MWYHKVPVCCFPISGLLDGLAVSNPSTVASSSTAAPITTTPSISSSTLPTMTTPKPTVMNNIPSPTKSPALLGTVGITPFGSASYEKENITSPNSPLNLSFTSDVTGAASTTTSTTTSLPGIIESQVDIGSSEDDTRKQNNTTKHSLELEHGTFQTNTINATIEPPSLTSEITSTTSDASTPYAICDTCKSPPEADTKELVPPDTHWASSGAMTQTVSEDSSSLVSISPSSILSGGTSDAPTEEGSSSGENTTSSHSTELQYNLSETPSSSRIQPEDIPGSYYNTDTISSLNRHDTLSIFPADETQGNSSTGGHSFSTAKTSDKFEDLFGTGTQGGSSISEDSTFIGPISSESLILPGTVKQEEHLIGEYSSSTTSISETFEILFVPVTQGGSSISEDIAPIFSESLTYPGIGKQDSSPTSGDFSSAATIFDKTGTSLPFKNSGTINAMDIFLLLPRYLTNLGQTLVLGFMEAFQLWTSIFQIRKI